MDEILDHPEAVRLLNPEEPVAALYLTFMHFVPDHAQPQVMINRLMERLAPGSYLSISQVVSDDAEVRQRMTDFALNNTRGSFGRFRRKAEVRAFFDGLDVVEPGLVDVNDWYPDGREEQQSTIWIEFGGLARKRA